MRKQLAKLLNNNQLGQILLVMIIVLIIAMNIRVSLAISSLTNRVNNIQAAVGNRGNGEERVTVDKERIFIPDTPIKGRLDAPIQIVEFSDFQCPYCARSSKVLQDLLDKYDGQVNVSYRHFLLSQNDSSLKIAEVAECAGEQDKFWEMHHILFENQTRLPLDSYNAFAEDIGLNMETFSSCLTEQRFREKVLNDYSDALEHGVRGTPTVFINGEMVSGYASINRLSVIVDELLDQIPE